MNGTTREARTRLGRIERSHAAEAPTGAKRPGRARRRAGASLVALVLGLAGVGVSLLVGGGTPAAAANVSCSPVAGNTIKTWVGAPGASFDLAANWSPSGIPGATNIICSAPGSSILMVANRAVAGANLQGSITIPATRTLTLTASATSVPATTGLTSVLTDVTVDGTLAGAMPADLGGSANVFRGVITGTGAKTLVSGATATIDNGMTLGTATAAGILKTAGTLNWTGTGQLQLGGGTTTLQVLSGGSLNIDVTDGYSINDFSTSATKPKVIVDSGGTLEKKTTTGTTYVYPFFDNNGLVKASVGTIDINNGNSAASSDAGTYQSTAPATINFANGTRTFTNTTAVAAGTGGVTLTGGNWNFPAAGTTATALNQRGGTLTGSVTVTSTFQWSGGIQGGTGTTTIDTGVTADLPAGAQVAGTHVFKNKGITNWGNAGGYFYLCDNSRFDNESGGTFNIASTGGYSLTTCGTGTPGFTNKAGGIVNKITATDTTYVSVPFDNLGTVNVNAGTLDLNAGGNSTGVKDTGTWNVPSGKTLRFSGGTRTENGATLSGVGTFDVSGGTFDFGTTDISVANLVVNGGTVAGSSTITSNFTWAGGTLSGAGTTTIGSGVTLSIPSGAALDDNHVLRNSGSATWGPIGYFYICNGAQFTNASGGVFHLQDTGGYALVDCGTGGSILNQAGGTITKDLGTNTSYLGVPLDNHGTVSASTGILQVQAGSRTGSTGDTGTFTTTSTGLLGLNGGTRKFDGGTISGNGTYVNGATVTGTPQIVKAIWDSGTFDYPGQATVTGSLSVPGAATLYGKIRNEGTVAFVGDAYRSLCGTAQIENGSGATFELTGGGGYSVNDCGSATSKIVNQAGGTITKKTSTGQIYLDVPTENDGTISIAKGVLSVTKGSPAGTSDNGNWTTSSGNLLGFDAGTRTFTSAATVTGAGQTWWSGGALAGDPTFDTTVQWNAGGPSGTGTTTIAPTGTLQWNGGVAMSGGHILNQGTTNWASGYIAMSDGATFQNAGLFDLKTGGGYAFQQGGGAATLFTNQATGTIRSNIGSLSYWQTQTHNDGTVNIQSGPISFDGPAGSLDNFAPSGLNGGTWILKDGLGVRSPNLTVLNADLRLYTGGYTSDENLVDQLPTLASISSGGRFELHRNFTVNGALANAGIVDVQAGRLEATTYTQSAGSTKLTGSTTSLKASANTVAINAGTLSGTGDVIGALSGNGTVSPGLSPGKLSVTQGYSPGSTGTLAVELNGATTAGVDYDQLAVTGTANLSGTLAVTIGAGYTPVAGHTYTVLTAGTRTGTFSSVTGLSLGGGNHLNVNYTPSAVVLSVAADPVVSIGDVSAVEGTTGTTTFNFPVTLSGGTSQTVTVPWSTSDGSATSPADYTAASGTVTFVPDDIAETISVTVKDDVLDEATETFHVDLGTPTNAGNGDNQANGNIQDDPADLAPTVSVDSASVTEGDTGSTPAPFHVTLSAPSGKTVTVDYATAAGTAGLADYTPASGTLTYTPGQTTKTVNVAVLGDLLDEDTETYSFGLSNPVATSITGSAGTGTILDDGDPQPTVSVDDVTISEGNAGTTNATFHLSLDTASGRTVSVPVSTTDVDADSPSDYTAYSGTVVIPAGDLGADVTVLVNGDTTPEPTETFTLDLGTPTNASVGDGQGLATINDDDVVVGPTSRTLNGFSVDDLRVVEGDDAVFTVHRSGDTGEAATVKFTTTNGTALAGSDYAARGLETLTFGIGVSSRTVTVDTSTDALVEANETFKLTLSAATNALIVDTSATATLNDPGAAPASIKVGDISVAEGGTATFTVTRTGDLGDTSTVKVATANGTALDPGDYTAVPLTTLTFVPGDPTETVTVPTSQNAVDSAKNLTFTLKLSAQTNATIADTAATATIVDDEGAPVATKANFFSVDDLRVTEGDTASVTVTRRGDTNTVATVKVASADSSAKAPGDYTAYPVAVTTFGLGESTKVIAIPTTEDTAAELAENFRVSLSYASTNGYIEDSSATITVNDDDQVLPQFSVDDIRVSEGGNAAFTITRTGSTAEAASVKYVTSNVTAVAGTDYTAAPLTTVSFGVGQATHTVSVPTTADAASELLETFRITLSVPTNAVLADTQGTATIVDAGNDPSVFRVDDLTVNEGGTATFTVSRAGDTTEAATVSWTTGNGTALAPTDFTAIPLTAVTFAPGEATRTVNVATTQNGIDSAKNLTFTLKLSVPVNATIGDSAATATIVDDEGAPVAVKANYLSVRDLRVDEGGVATITIVRRGDTNTVATVKVATGGMATPGADYTPQALTTVTFGVGETTKTITVATTEDAIAELTSETFTLALSAASTNAVIEDTSATITIIDED
jgi:hypothetical protein